MSRITDHSKPFPVLRSPDQIRRSLEQALLTRHRESWWQDFLCSHLPALMPQYQYCIPKLNIGIGQTRFPDFLVITRSGFLDVVEIKTPSTPLLQLDQGRGFYFWSREMGVAISQMENYLALCAEFRLAIADQLMQRYGMMVSVIRPQGIIIAGNTGQFRSQREKDEFRRLAQGLGQVRVMAYDEC